MNMTQKSLVHQSQEIRKSKVVAVTAGRRNNARKYVGVDCYLLCPSGDREDECQMITKLGGQLPLEPRPIADDQLQHDGRKYPQIKVGHASCHTNNSTSTAVSNSVASKSTVSRPVMPFHVDPYGSGSRVVIMARQYQLAAMPMHHQVATG